MSAALALLLAAAAAAAPAPTPLSRGGELFFRGDLDGAVARWKEAREDVGGSRELDALLASALTALGKRDLQAKRWPGARARFTEALAIDPSNRSLRRLELTAELAEQTGGLKSLKPEELDAAEEMDRLLTALLLMDRPAAPPAPAAAVETAAAAPASTAPAPAPAAAPPAEPAAAAKAPPAAVAKEPAQPEATPEEREKARAAYERGLERYYAGDYDAASGAFHEAVRLDPALDRARRGVALVRAALTRRDAQKRYEDALRSFYNGDLNAAREKLREALMLDPSHAKARETLARLDAPPPPPQ